MSEQCGTRVVQDAAVQPTIRNRHRGSVYPALAMLAGLHLDAFTPLAVAAMTAEALAAVRDSKADSMVPNIDLDGQAYTEREYRAWLREAGLAYIQRRVLAAGYSIIYGRKA